MTVRLLITLLQEQKDAQISAVTLQTLNQMLQDYKLLAFQEEPEDCLDAFHNWLLHVVSDESGRFSTEVKNCSMEALLALSLNTGSLTAILSAIRVLILSFTKTGENKPEEFNSLRMVPLLRQLADWQVDLILSPLTKDRIFGGSTQTAINCCRKLDNFVERIFGQYFGFFYVLTCNKHCYLHCWRVLLIHS